MKIMNGNIFALKMKQRKQSAIFASTYSYFGSCVSEYRANVFVSSDVEEDGSAPPADIAVAVILHHIWRSYV